MMKKRNLFLILLLVVLGTFALTACGTQGETGAQGPVGEKGPVGEVGDQGAQGDKGATGVAGEDGEDGIVGVDGEDAAAPSFQVTLDGLQYKLEGSEEWMTLVTIQDLIGYSEHYTITFDSTAGSEEETLVEQIWNNEIALPVPTRAGYTFIGWSADGGNNICADNLLTIKGDADLTAVWGSTVTVLSNAIDEAFDVSALTEGETIALGKMEAGNDGYTMNVARAENYSTACGFYWNRIYLSNVSGEFYQVVGVTAAGLAEFAGAYDVVIGSHDLCTDTASLAQFVALMDTVQVGEIVQLNGVDFTATAGDLAAGSFTHYTGALNSTVVTEGDTFTLVEATREGRTFLGYTPDSINLVEAGEITPTGNVTYTPVFDYVVTYDAVDGTVDPTSEGIYTVEEARAALPEATLADMAFEGWYSDAELTNKLDCKPLQTSVIYAKYIPITTVTYDYNGAVLYTDFTAMRQAMIDDYNAFAETAFTLDDVSTSA